MTSSISQNIYNSSFSIDLLNPIRVWIQQLQIKPDSFSEICQTFLTSPEHFKIHFQQKEDLIHLRNAIITHVSQNQIEKEEKWNLIKLIEEKLQEWFSFSEAQVNAVNLIEAFHNFSEASSPQASFMEFSQSFSKKSTLTPSQKELYIIQNDFINSLVKDPIKEKDPSETHKKNATIALIVAKKLIDSHDKANLQNISQFFEDFYYYSSTSCSFIHVQIFDAIILQLYEKDRMQECIELIHKNRLLILNRDFLLKPSKEQQEELITYFSQAMHEASNIGQARDICIQAFSLFLFLQIPLNEYRTICFGILQILLCPTKIPFLIQVCQSCSLISHTKGLIEELFRHTPFALLPLSIQRDWYLFLWEYFTSYNQVEYCMYLFLDSIRFPIEYLKSTDALLAPPLPTQFPQSSLLSKSYENLGEYILKLDDIFFQKFIDLQAFFFHFDETEIYLNDISIKILSYTIFCFHSNSLLTIDQRKHTVNRLYCLILTLKQEEERRLLANDLSSSMRKIALECALSIYECWKLWNEIDSSFNENKLINKQKVQKVIKQKLSEVEEKITQLIYKDHPFLLFLSLALGKEYNAKRLLAECKQTLLSRASDKKETLPLGTSSSKQSKSSQLKTTASQLPYSKKAPSSKPVEASNIASSSQIPSLTKEELFQEYINKLSEASSFQAEKIIDKFILEYSVSVHLEKHFSVVDLLLQREEFKLALIILSNIPPLLRQKENGKKYNGRLIEIVLAPTAPSNISKSAMHKISDPLVYSEVAALYRKKNAPIEYTKKLQSLFLSSVAAPSQQTSLKYEHLSTKELTRDHHEELPQNISSKDVFSLLEIRAKEKRFELKTLAVGGSHVVLGLVYQEKRMGALLIPFHGAKTNRINEKYLKKGYAWIEKHFQTIEQ